MPSDFTIGQLAKAVGVNLQTIRFYERARLLQPLARLPSGYRVYGKEEAQRLFFIKRAQTLGFTLKEVSDLLNLRVKGKGTCTDVKRKTEEKLRAVETKIRQLRHIARTLGQLLEACDSGQTTDACPVLKSLAGKGEILQKAVSGSSKVSPGTPSSKTKARKS